jgi:hypothetical protein
MHIPPDRILPQDLIDIFDHGPADEPHAAPMRHRMHVTDAQHAMMVEPSRWKLDAEAVKPFKPVRLVDAPPAEMDDGVI